MIRVDQSLAPITLDELDGLAALQTRVDRKYVLPACRLGEVLADLPPDARILDIDGAREFGYDSLYLDTAELTAYHLAGRKRRRRFKVRRRVYTDSGQAWFEVKTRVGGGLTVKTRIPDGDGDAAHLGPEARCFVAATLERVGIAGVDPAALAPTLRTTYRRTTFYLPTDRARVTVDLDLAVANDDDALTWDGLAIVETKAGRAPTELDRRLWRRGHRPVCLSKYGAGLAAITPDLPDEKWHRVLTHHIPRALAA